MLLPHVGPRWPEVGPLTCVVTMWSAIWAKMTINRAWMATSVTCSVSALTPVALSSDS